MLTRELCVAVSKRSEITAASLSHEQQIQTGSLRICGSFSYYQWPVICQSALFLLEYVSIR